MIRTITYDKVKPIATNKNIGPKNQPRIGIAENKMYNNHAAIIAANAAAKNTRAAIIRIKKKDAIMSYAVKNIYIIVTSIP
jgi:hypothetical protein